MTKRIFDIPVAFTLWNIISMTFRIDSIPVCWVTVLFYQIIHKSLNRSIIRATLLLAIGYRNSCCQVQHVRTQETFLRQKNVSFSGICSFQFILSNNDHYCLILNSLIYKTIDRIISSIPHLVMRNLQDKAFFI